MRNSPFTYLHTSATPHLRIYTLSHLQNYRKNEDNDHYLLFFCNYGLGDLHKYVN